MGRAMKLCRCGQGWQRCRTERSSSRRSLALLLRSLAMLLIQQTQATLVVA